MSVGVVGIGAVGLFVSYQLMSMGNSVTSYVRRVSQKQRIEKDGISLTGESTLYPEVNMIDELGEHDLLIICTKQTHLNDVIHRIQEDLSRFNQLLFLQNGLGHIELLDALDHPGVVVGVCEHGLTKQSDIEVTHTGMGLIRVSALNNSDLTSVTSLHSDAFPVQMETSLDQTLHEKLVINSVINPLTALFDVTNGSILTSDALLSLAHRLTVEASDVLQLSPDYMWQRVLQVCELTAANTSSMRSDIKQGRLTEIDYMNGYLLKISRDQCPTHDVIFQMIKAKEALSGVS
ncbi:2-dehydropantoate 2-reductase [Alkalibacillus flavidus]|uniref:2-dehydropantoate 2-reductase n=1 Tax=Alkalibacillus flavidus TaxID=546021 RepID=A0ABV2KR28_9BACI